MKVGFDIEIDKSSENYLNIPEKYKYKLVDNLQPTNWLIIHTYPISDTVQNGEVLGYTDALFMDLHIYDARHMEYIIIENRDGIDNWEVPINRIYTYKDGSTAIVIKGSEDIKVDIFQSIIIRR
jgi:hypothetical protein